MLLQDNSTTCHLNTWYWYSCITLLLYPTVHIHGTGASSSLYIRLDNGEAFHSSQNFAPSYHGVGLLASNLTS